MLQRADAEEPASHPAVVADLNRLLRLDHDAAEAYGAAIRALRDGRNRRVLIRCRADHQRHIMELAELIRRMGGEPVDPRGLAAEAFRWGVQSVAGVGGDREVLSAIRANEERTADEYWRRSLAELPAEAAELLRRNAADEERHLAWVEGMLGDGLRQAS